MTEEKYQPKVLLVDDEKGLRLGTKRLLESEGYAVSAAENGTEGIKLGTSNDFDLAVIDMRMPDVDGIKVLDEILRAYPNTICFIATAYASYETAIEATKTGAFGYILKPFSPEEILSRLKEGYAKRLLLLETEKWKREREERLLEVAFEKTRLNTIVNSISDGVFVVNKNGETVLFNPALTRYFNSDEIELEKNILEKIHPKIKELIEKILLSENPDKKSFSDQIELKPHGELFIEATSSAVPHPDGTLAGVVVVIKNITELKRIEHLKSQFVSMVSHELKAPLAAVYGYLKLLTDDSFDINKEQQTSYMKRSMIRLDSLLKMVNDLLDISRIELKTIQREIKQININEIIDSIIELFSTDIQNKNLSIKKNYSSSATNFFADSDEMTRLFTNIISNAIKYNRENGLIKIITENTEHHLYVTISDTGIGLKENEKEKLFQEFYRAKNEQTKNISGTGLGLSIVKKIVESYSGKIEVESEYGEGTSIQISFPLKEKKVFNKEESYALS